jgi:hypothetical protein
MPNRSRKPWFQITTVSDFVAPYPEMKYAHIVLGKIDLTDSNFDLFMNHIS